MKAEREMENGLPRACGHRNDREGIPGDGRPGNGREPTEPTEIIPVSADQIQLISTVVQQMMAPVMENIGTILRHNTEAMERIAATQQLMSERISELEKEVRLKTPVSRAQEKRLGEAARERARELLDGKGYGDDRKAVTRLAGMIRKSLLARYGIDSLREAPAYDYAVAMEQARSWNDILALRDVAKEARQRAEDAVRNSNGCAGMDDRTQVARQDPERHEPDPAAHHPGRGE